MHKHRFLDNSSAMKLLQDVESSRDGHPNEEMGGASMVSVLEWMYEVNLPHAEEMQIRAKYPLGEIALEMCP